MRTVTTCWRSSADVTVPVWPSRADEQIIRTRTPTCTPESSGADAPTWLADRHIEHVAPAADKAHRRPIVSPRWGRRRWPHSVHPSHSGSSRWTAGIGEERWALAFLNISCLTPSSMAPAPRWRPRHRVAGDVHSAAASGRNGSWLRTGRSACAPCRCAAPDDRGTTGDLTDLVATRPDTPPHSRDRTRRSARHRRRQGR